MENNHFQWINPLFLWPFSSSQTVTNYQRVTGEEPAFFRAPQFDDLPQQQRAEQRCPSCREGWAVTAWQGLVDLSLGI